VISDMRDGAIDPDDIVGSAPYDPSRPGGRIDGLDLVVSSGLPIEPSPGEIGRRIARHGFNDAGLLPASCGPVGPRPGDQTRAIRAGSILFVDRELALAIDRRESAERAREQRRRRDERHRLEQERRWLAVIDRASAALGLDRDQVKAFRRDDMLFTTTFRVMTSATSYVDVPIDDDVIARSATSAHDVNGPAVAIAKAVRAALVERKLDEEEAGRSGWMP
jgi:hypothetical protein